MSQNFFSTVYWCCQNAGWGRKQTQMWRCSHEGLLVVTWEFFKCQSQCLITNLVRAIEGDYMFFLVVILLMTLREQRCFMELITLVWNTGLSDKINRLDQVLWYHCHFYLKTEKYLPYSNHRYLGNRLSFFFFLMKSWKKYDWSLQ